MNARRALTIAATAALLIVSVPEAASSGTWWEGQFNPSVLLDSSQVERRDLAPAFDTDSDCWDEWSCTLTEAGLPGEYVSAEWLDAPMVDADGGEHTDCTLIVTESPTSLIVCVDGWTEEVAV